MDGHEPFDSCFPVFTSLNITFAVARREVQPMNQKSNALTVDLNIHFESSLELRKMIRWLVPLALVQLAIRIYHGS